MMQAKVLRVLEDGRVYPVGGERPVEVEVRLIAATNRDLKGDVEAGRFREDLYYQVNIITIRLPPLRTRPEDSPLLVDHYLRLSCRENGRSRELTPGARATLTTQPWPGNVRELKNVIERLVLWRGSPASTPRGSRRCCRTGRPRILCPGRGCASTSSAPTSSRPSPATSGASRRRLPRSASTAPTSGS
jgi:transcriptional regulator with GAF, ATPase, and Fis domain